MNNFVQKLQHPLFQKMTKCGGLPQTLHLTCGSRVMLKRNIMAAQGLVNEQHGTRSEKGKSILFNIKCRMGQLLGIILMNYMKKK